MAFNFSSLSLLTKDIFFKNYDKLQHSLSNHRMFTQKYVMNRIQSKLPSFNRNTNKGMKVKIGAIDNEISSPADEIDTLI